MFSQTQTSNTQLSESHPALGNWLQERQKLLVQYCELAGLPPYEQNSSGLPELDAIKAFCQTLVDYVSTGHFEVYEKFVDEDVTDAKLSGSKRQLYPKITESTEDALAFNDAFAELADEKDLKSFDLQLSRLGQKLEERFALEDELIGSFAN